MSTPTLRDAAAELVDAHDAQAGYGTSAYFEKIRVMQKRVDALRAALAADRVAGDGKEIAADDPSRWGWPVQDAPAAVDIHIAADDPTRWGWPVQSAAPSPQPAAVAQAEPVAAAGEPRDTHRGGNSYGASMLRDMLARIHGDGGHYVEQHGLERAMEDAHELVAAWRAAAPPPPERAAPEAMTDECIDKLIALFWKIRRDNEGFYPGTIIKGERLAVRAIIAARDAQWLAQHAAAQKGTP